MQVNYRTAQREDSLRIAELDYIASGGAIEFLFRDLVPDSTPVQTVAFSLENDFYPHSYRSSIIAEIDNDIIGMSLSFPAEFHCITDEMRDFFPPDRLEHFNQFFSTRVENSYFLDAICVEKKFRCMGIGEKLLLKTKDKAHDEGFTTLSLLVFADNIRALKFYKKHGFAAVRQVELNEHDLIPHNGGCILMKAHL